LTLLLNLIGPQHPVEAQRILDGILDGISIDYTGPRDVTRISHNLTSALDNAAAVTRLVEGDVRAGKKAGPFNRSPFEHFITSPLGVVLKKHSNKPRGSRRVHCVRHSPESIAWQAIEAMHRCGVIHADLRWRHTAMILPRLDACSGLFCAD
jgi:hypothetical protein